MQPLLDKQSSCVWKKITLS